MVISTGAGTALPGPPKLKIEDVLSTNITHINSPCQFFVQDRRSAALVDMINMWGRQAESLPAEKLKPEGLIVDSSYLLKSPIDDNWYRATLIKTDFEKKAIRLYLVDFGDMLELSFSEIGNRLLTLGVRLAAFPPLALLCIWDDGIEKHMGEELNKYLNTKLAVTVRITAYADTVNGGYHVSIPEFEGKKEAVTEEFKRLKAKETEEIRKLEELKAKEAALAEEARKTEEIKAKEAEEKRKVEELKTREVESAEERRKTEDIKAKEVVAEEKRKIEVLVLKTKEAEAERKRIEAKETEEKKKIEMEENQRKKLEAVTSKYEPLCKIMKEVLREKVEKVTVSNVPIDSPCCVLTFQNAGTTQKEGAVSMDLAAAKKHLEINPANLIIQSLLQKVSKDENDVTIKNFVLLLFDIGLLTSGFPLLNPMDHVACICHVMKRGLGI